MREGEEPVWDITTIPRLPQPPQPSTLITQKLHHYFTTPASPPSSPSLPPPLPPSPPPPLPPRADGYKRVLVPWGSDTGEPSAPLQPASQPPPPPLPLLPPNPHTDNRPSRCRTQTYSRPFFMCFLASRVVTTDSGVYRMLYALYDGGVYGYISPSDEKKRK